MFSQKIETITPQKALEYLSKNVSNRRKKPRKIKEYATDMMEGRWRFNGESIKFDRDGYLIDGQNRLFACIQANKSFQTVVQRGLDRDVFKYIDRGVGRSNADTFHVCGYKFENQLAAAIRVLHSFKRYKRLVDGVTISNADILNLLEEYEGIEDSVNFVANHKHMKGTSQSIISALHYLFAEKASGQANEFVDRFYDGAELKRGHPILVLRNRLRELTVNSKTERREQFELMIRAWNHFRQGKSLTRLAVNGTIPEII